MLTLETQANNRRVGVHAVDSPPHRLSRARVVPSVAGQPPPSEECPENEAHREHHVRPVEGDL